ncbi:hypothetical protein EG329_009489 [Mollisiaceae sp. DMI_Dod_QoI]|nr:hypothetical protein EG329_009489 [Helotiales sp. DMI_Dod_QoI]
MDATTRTAVLEKVKEDWNKQYTTVIEGRWVIGPDGSPRRQKEGDHNDVVKKEGGKGWVLVEKDGSSKMILVAEKAVAKLFDAWVKAKSDNSSEYKFVKYCCKQRYAGALQADVKFIVRSINRHLPKPAGAIEAARENRSVSGAAARQARRERAEMAGNNEAERAAEPGRTLVSEKTEWDSGWPVVKRVFKTADGEQEVVYDHSKQGLGREHRYSKHQGWQAYHDRVAASKKR